MVFSFLKKNKPPKDSLKPVVLLILDGWGIAPASKGNAIALAKTPNMDGLTKLYPNGQLFAAGETVGLPAGEVGNTEVGHLTIGAGRTILQELKRISKTIEDDSFYQNKAFLDALEHTKKHSSRFHIMGLIGSGHVHSSADHLYALLEFCKRNKITNIALHLFTDGRDSPPKEAVEHVKKIEQYLATNQMGAVASIMGRYWAMDRDRRWDRTQKAYEALVLGRGQVAVSASQVLETSYAANTTDEFIPPTLITSNSSPITINDNDAVIFFNFRVDRPRQITMAFTMPDFEKLKKLEVDYEPGQGKTKKEKVSTSTFKREKVPQNLFFVTMTQYQANLPVSAIAFPLRQVDNPLGQVISDNKLSQLHLSESEKERFVTYHFNGFHEEPMEGEEDKIIPSPNVPTYDKKPQMSVAKITSEIKNQVSKNIYSFMIANIANPDMVAHTGNLEATIKACEAVDLAVGEILKSVLEANGTLVITADHGNAEGLLSFSSNSYFYTTGKGSMNTDHSSSPVPLIIANMSHQNQPTKLPQGTLADVAPTILSIMGIPKPAVMTGNNLLEPKPAPQP